MGRALSFLLWLAPLLCFALLLAVWPLQNPPDVPACCPWLTGEIRMMLIVLIAGAIGASLDAARNFSAFQGRGAFDANWTAWYLFRIPQGMGLALILYLVVRGGLVPSTGTTVGTDPTVNPFGFAALSALAGMFAKPALRRLEEVFAALFGDDDTSPPARLVLDPIATKVAVGAADDKLKVVLTGKGFTQKTAALVGNESRNLTFTSDTEVTLDLVAGDVATAGVLKVSLANGGGKSEARDLIVE